MKAHPRSRLPIHALIISSLLLAGCVTQPQPFYHWGDYQPQVYGHFTKDSAPQEQITSLEAGLEEARAKGKPVPPPGYLAHLGILQAQAERTNYVVLSSESRVTAEATLIDLRSEQVLWKGSATASSAEGRSSSGGLIR